MNILFRYFASALVFAFSLTVPVVATFIVHKHDATGTRFALLAPPNRLLGVHNVPSANLVTNLQMGRQQAYSDDFFGLIFLSSAFLGDQAFSTIFLLVSAVASIAVSVGKLRADPIVPGMVALLSVFGAVTLRLVAPMQVGGMESSTTVISVEAGEALCSIAYGFHQHRKQQDSDGD
jgi:hypothetical protein